VAEYQKTGLYVAYIFGPCFKPFDTRQPRLFLTPLTSHLYAPQHMGQ
jgi:hypothetical protein